MAGSLCGSAWAQSSIQQLAGFVNGQGTFTATPATELKAGHQYVFVNDQTNNEAYGHELSGSTITESTIGLSTPLADNDDVKQYVWTVGITESPKGFFSYNFTNVETGKLLRVNVGFTAIEKNTKVEERIRIRISYLMDLLFLLLREVHILARITICIFIHLLLLSTA